MQFIDNIDGCGQATQEPIVTDRLALSTAERNLSGGHLQKYSILRGLSNLFLLPQESLCLD